MLRLHGSGSRDYWVTALQYAIVSGVMVFVPVVLLVSILGVSALPQLLGHNNLMKSALKLLEGGN